MNDRLEDAIRRLYGDGSDKKDEIYNKIIAEAQKKPLGCSASSRSFPKRRYIAAAIALCCIATLSIGGKAIAGSVMNFIRSVRVGERVQMNELAADFDENFRAARECTDPDSIEYQIFTKPVETPCYLFRFYYKGYSKLIILDKDTENLGEVSDWLRENLGIVGMAAETEEEAKAYLENVQNGSRSISYGEIKERMGEGCLLPSYLPDGMVGGKIVQYNEYLGSVNISYIYGANEEKGYNDFISLEIQSEDTKFGKNLIASLSVNEQISTEKIGGWDVYHSGGYYVWCSDGFLYVLCSEFAGEETCVKIIRNMY
ncbi:MAG: hypothetical protein ACI4XJ_05810 [Eubacteriales bacterium]